MQSQSMHLIHFLSFVSVGLLASTMIGVSLLVLTQDRMIFCMLIISSRGSRTGQLQTLCEFICRLQLILIYINFLGKDICQQGVMKTSLQSNFALPIKFSAVLVDCLNPSVQTTLQMNHHLGHCLDVQAIFILQVQLSIYFNVLDYQCLNHSSCQQALLSWLVL